MPRSGATTRQNILDAAQGIILQRGFAGASIDRIITEAGITKGAFFHHFPNKAALAEAVITRFIETEAALFDGICVRAERLSDDPVQRLLNILGLYADALDQHPEVVEGCLYASVALQRSEYPETISSLTSASIEQTVEKLRPYYQAALAAAPPRKAVDVNDLGRPVRQRPVKAPLFWQAFARTRRCRDGNSAICRPKPHCYSADNRLNQIRTLA